MATPCEKKGYKIGQVFKVVEENMFAKGSIIILDEDDGTGAPFWVLLEGGFNKNQTTPGKYNMPRSCESIKYVARIYPPEEPKVTKTIILMGKSYSKDEIETALKDVKPVGE